MRAGMPSTACASTPRDLSASRTLRPESSDTSRSEEVPPISTATPPKARASTIRLAAQAGSPHDAHLGLEVHPVHSLDSALHVR